MPSYGNMFGGGQPPTNNNLWVGNNYSSGYSQMSKSNYPNNMNNQSGMTPNNFMTQQPQSINNILQVMGPESAQGYLIGPDSKIILVDSNRPVVYMKQSDSLGYSETRAFALQEIPLFSSETKQPESQEQSAQTQEKSSEYVTKTEFEDFKKVIEDLVMKDE